MNKQRYSKVIFDVTLNSICYFILYLSLIWDKLYYIIKKEGDNSFNYFLLYHHDYCPTHASTTCGCKMNMSKDDLLFNIQSSTYFYKVCSSFFTIIGGRLKFLQSKSKLDIVHY